MCGCYEVSDSVISFNTRIPRVDKDGVNQLERAKKDLLSKVYFYGGWVFIVNAAFYSGYSGPKNKVVIANEINKIPLDIYNALVKGKVDRVSILYRYSIDTTINHKSNIINNNINNNIQEEKKIIKEKKKYSRVTDISEEDMNEIARDLNVNYDVVKLNLGKMIDWCHAKGKSYANYRLALIIWVKNYLERGGIINGRPKIAVMPDQATS